jgi:hypothetical protein
MRSDRRRQVVVSEEVAVIPVIVPCYSGDWSGTAGAVIGERDCGDGVTCAWP